MQSQRHGARAVLLIAMLAAAGPAQAQSTEAAPPPDDKPVAGEQVSTVGAAPLDPLTPPKVDEPPPQAPGTAGAAVSTATVPAQADAVVAEVRRRLQAAADRGGPAEKADLAALRAFYLEGNGRAQWTGTEGLSVRGQAVVAELRRASDFGLEPSAYEIVSLAAGAAPETAADAEIALGLAILKYARHARGGRTDPRSISNMIDWEVRPYEPRSVLMALAASEGPDAYLRQLHPQHEQFERLRQALLDVRAGGPKLAALGLKPGASIADTERRILVNMERWRWLPSYLGQFYVWDNVPEQMTRVVKEGRLVLTERIVVGKPSQQTPEFTAPMKFVIFHPSWGVPEGIKTNELAPMLKRAAARNTGFFFGETNAVSKALARHELVVMHNGRPVNPDSVNWSAVDVRQFQFTQPPSAKNVLGIVKFRFPNKFDVYMHDTQDRHLFSHGVRAYSHGCMRVQNPMRLAETILAHDKGWSADRVQGFVARGQTADITLDKQVPVYITYFTAAVDDAGHLKQFGDLYGRDARVASAIAGKAVAVASVAPPPVEKPEPGAASPQEAKREKKGNQPAKTAKPGGGGDFNPFERISAN